MKHEKVYIVTDGCMWELNRKAGSEHAHAIEVVDLATGAVRYITSGSKIVFVEGTISDIRSQETYNKATETVPRKSKGVPNRAGRKDKSKGKQTTGV